jgi:hypothetical protein
LPTEPMKICLDPAFRVGEIDVIDARSHRLICHVQSPGTKTQVAKLSA